MREEHGPWLILAASFSGEGAEQQAQDLILELRSSFKLTAYLHRQDFNFNEPIESRIVDRYGEPAKMRYASDTEYEAYAVLVGNFESVEDPQLAKTLEKIKYAHPDCLDLAKRGNQSSQRFIGLRELQRRMNLDPAKHKKGPMGSAFVTRNPYLPEEYFRNGGGLDDFVIGLNQNVKYSLLKNPGRYTVRVASFAGKDTMKSSEIEEIERTGRVTDKLEVAAYKANRLTIALRNRGVEAYEFHDRLESLVTVGSFDSVGEERPDGKIEINPAVHEVLKIYGATRTPLPGRQQSLGLQPRTLDGIAFDVQPMPVMVPRKSIAADYARHPR